MPCSAFTTGTASAGIWSGEYAQLESDVNNGGAGEGDGCGCDAGCGERRVEEEGGVVQYFIRHT